jgi:hypothetical protein
MPNKEAKNRKRKRLKKNMELKRTGRTSKQRERYKRNK